MPTQGSLSDFADNPSDTPIDAATTSQNQQFEKQPKNRMPIKHLLIGSPKAVRLTIHDLHLKGYAEAGAWSPFQRTANPDEVISVLVRYLLLD